MSYTPGFAPDGRSQWMELPPDLQEIALDELERLTEYPPEGFEFIADAIREEGATRTHVFVHVLIDRTRREVVVVGTGTATTPISGP